MTSAIAPGTVLAGKFRIESILGQGGMGVVVAAHHLVLDEPVALKFLLFGAMSNEAVARFEREARAAVKIKSEHVARVSDVGRLDDGAPYMVMELLRGKDLGAVLAEHGPLPVEDVVDYVLQAGEAIAEAHGLGIVHRDLKPQNLFLTHRADGSPCVKVLDFGISKLTRPGSGSGDDVMTRTSAVMGSPLYMSPEQLMSARDVDMRTDIWAIGVICFELLTGHLPFSAETLPQLCMAIAQSAPATLRSFRPDLPSELERVIERCLEKDRARRLATMSELALELLKFSPRRGRLSAERIERLSRAAGFSASAVALPPASERADVPVQAASQALATQTAGGFGTTTPPPKAGGLRLLASLGVAVLIAGVAALLVIRRAAAPIPEPLASAASAAEPIQVADTPLAAPAASVEPPSASASAAAAAAAAAPAGSAPAAPAAKTKFGPRPDSPRSPESAPARPVSKAPVSPVSVKPKPVQDGLGGRL